LSLDILIPVYNGKKHLLRLLNALKENPPEMEYRIYLFDNNSSDGGARLVEGMYPDVVVIYSQRNLGYGAALNRLIEVSNGEYLCTMNTDIYFDTDVFTPLLNKMEEDKRILGIAPVLMMPGKGIVSTAGDMFPNLWTFLIEFLPIAEMVNRVLPGFRLWSSLKPYSFYKKGGYVNHIEGSFVLYRRKAFKKYGLFDESFFLYFEDMDLQIRFPKKSMYILPVVAYHVWGGSMRTKSSELVKIRHRSLLGYFSKHRTPFETLFIKMFLKTWGITW